MSIDTVSDLPPRVQYVAAAAQTNFPYPFPVFSDGDLVVDRDGVTAALNTDYTVTGEGDDLGGDVTWIGTAFAGGEIVTIYRDIAIERDTDISQNGQWLSSAYNDEQDKVFLILQQLKAQLARCMRLPIISEVADVDLELEPTAFANMFLAFDGTCKPVPAALSATTITQAIVGQLLFPRTTVEIAAGVVPANYFYSAYDFRRYGILDDGATDNTTAILALWTAFASQSAVFYAAPNVKFTFNTVVLGLPPRCSLRDESMVNAWNTAGFRQKTAGFYEGSDASAVNDFQYVISSGHNAAIMLDNRGTAASSSGTNGIAMIMWSRGRFTKQAGQEGIRGLARTEFSKLSSTKWFWVLRRMVPWVARDYELWYTGKSYGANAYIINGSVVYTTTLGGTAGASQPVHTTGTVTDGGILWTAVLPNIDSSIYSVDQHGQIATNTSPTDAIVAYLKADQYSPGGGQANLYVEADGVSQTARLRLRPTNGAGAAVAMPSVMAQDGVGVRFMKSDFTTEYFRLDDTNGFTFQDGFSVKRSDITYSASMTPSAGIANSFRIDVSNGTAFTINAPTSPRAGQQIRIRIRNVSGGVLGVATWNAVFKMVAWVQPANGFSRMIDFEYDGSNWVECIRSAADVTN